MDFLLECIGFPPNHDLDALVQRIRAEGETVAWRGPSGVHLRCPLAGGLEVRLDREEDQDHWTVWPHFEVNRRLRVALESVDRVPDSPYDALLHGTANPPLPTEEVISGLRDDYSLATYVNDARRLPTKLTRGHVLAVSICGFALDIDYVGPNEGVREHSILEEPHGAALMPLLGGERPGGCMELSLRIRGVRHLENPWTSERVAVVEADAPGRPLDLFVSRWQLEQDDLPLPHPGWRIEGAFLFSGRVSGGLPAAGRRRLG